MDSNERIDFEQKCHKVFGHSSKHIQYKLVDIEDRLQKVEIAADHSNNVIAAMILRFESLINVLVSGFTGFTNKKLFMKVMEEESRDIYKDKNNKLIEKL